MCGNSPVASKLKFGNSGKVLVDHIIKIFKEYEIGAEDVKKHIVFVTDRGPYGLVKAGFKRLTCYAHVIHNLISEMLSEPRVKEVMKHCGALPT